MNVHHMHARELLAIPQHEVWNLPLGKYLMTFDDGSVVETTARRNMYTRYCWAIHERYPETPLLPRHHIGMATLNRMLHGEVLGPAVIDCKIATNGNMKFLETLWELVYIVAENIFNDWSENLEAYVTSISPMDFIELRNYPPIKTMHDEIKSKPWASEKMIEEHLAALKEILLTHKPIQYNQAVRSVKTGIGRIAQVMQILGPLGFRTDADSVLFRPAILASYADGINKPRETAIESRDATINIFYQKKPMQDSEWGNRVIQIMAAVLQNLVDTDCGSTSYVDMPIEDKETLQDTDGKFYLNPEGKLEAITPNHTHLIGTIVKMRSVTTCQYQDRYSICTTCFGELAYSVPENTNIGHTCCTQLIGPIGQYMLSFKHYSATATAERAKLLGEAAEYLFLDKAGFYTRLKPELKDARIKVIFHEKEAGNILDINYVGDMTKLNVERITKLTSIDLEVHTANGIHYPHLEVGVGSINPSFTLDFLAYIKDNGYEVLDKGWFAVDMKSWDFTKPLLVSPYVQFSPPQYMRQVIGFIKGTQEQNKRVADSVIQHASMGSALLSLRELVGRKLRINVAHIEVVLQATKVASVSGRDYRPPLNKEDGQPVGFDELMRNRSLAATFAWQSHEDVLFSPTSILVTNRPPHPFDHLYPDRK